MANTNISPATAQEGLSQGLPRVSHTHMLPNAPRKLSGHVRRSGDDYAGALANLLPTGLAWPRDLASTLMKVVSGLGQVWGTVDSRAADLLERESDPRITEELLPDWERNFGVIDAGTISFFTRHQLLVWWMTLEGSPSRQFFIGVAALFGYDITITEFSPFVCGTSRCGDTRHLNPDDPKRYRWEIGPVENRFVWLVTALNSSSVLLDPLFKRFQPAHTAVVFNYFANSPVLSPASLDPILSTEPPNLYYKIIRPHLFPQSYGMSLIPHPPNAVLITRKIIPDSWSLFLTFTPPDVARVRLRFPASHNLVLSPTAPIVAII